MRTAIQTIVLAASVSVCLAERPTMLPPPPEEEVAKDLLRTLSSACSERNFRQYIDCFTPGKAASVRRSAEDLFICHDFSMEVLEHFVISSDDESIVLGVRYRVDKSGDDRTFHSKVVLKNVEGEWKIDSEQVKKVKTKEAPQVFASARNPACPDGKCNLQVPQAFAPARNPACPDGKCNLQTPPVRRFPNPANGGEEAVLPRDIGWRPGPSCVNGQCRIK